MTAARAQDDKESLGEFLSLAATLANLRADYARANEYLQEAERQKAGKDRKAPVEEIPAGGRLVVGLVNRTIATDPNYRWQRMRELISETPEASAEAASQAARGRSSSSSSK